MRRAGAQPFHLARPSATITLQERVAFGSAATPLVVPQRQATCAVGLANSTCVFLDARRGGDFHAAAT